MNSLIIDTLIWSFAIYGFIDFVQENFISSVCYIICKVINMTKLYKNIIAKKERWLYNNKRILENIRIVIYARGFWHFSLRLFRNERLEIEKFQLS